MGDDDLTLDDLPYIRKTGRYAFFAVLAFAMAMLISAMGKLAGLLDRGDMQMIVPVISVATFLALRDMSKAYDWHAHRVADIRRKLREDEHGR